MSQLDPSRYKRLSMPMDYGVSDGLYWDSTNSELVMVIDDIIKLKVPLTQTSAQLLQSDGTDIEPAALASLTTSQMAKPRFRVLEETVTRASMTDGGAAAGTKQLSLSIPAGSIVRAVSCSAITGFTGDTSAVIIIGDGSDTDRYNTGTPSVFTTAAAGVALGVPSGTAFHAAAIQPTVTITSAADFTNVAAGSITLQFWIYEPI